MLKLLLSQMVLRYDIKPDADPRPQNPVSYSDPNYPNLDRPTPPNYLPG